MVFESMPGKNLAGGKALFPDPLRHNTGTANSIGYVDGHAKTVTVERFSDLLWIPHQIPTSDVSLPKGSTSR